MVGVGKANFGIADAGTMAKGVSQGIPVTMVASLFQDTPMVVVSLKKTGIKAPKDIEGHSIAMAPWESTMFVFKVFCKLNQVDLNKVKIIPLSFATKIPSLLSRKVDSLGGYILELGSPLLMGLKPEDKVEINLIKFSDYGVQMYSNGIIVNNKYLEENSANVKAFVKATMKGLEYAIANPGETAEFLKRHSQISQQLLLAKWKSVVPLHRSETTKKHGLGWMDKARWEFTQKIMLEYGGQKKAVPLEQLFTNKFLN
jgi:NitT/TauT family transport system substrate-binding protein